MNIVCTGGNGFLGQHLMRQLDEAGYDSVYPVYHQNYDLRNRNHVERLLSHTGHIDVLFHLAARVGGIGENMAHPAQFFYDNLLMGLNLIDAAAKRGIGRFVCVGTTCSYPKYCAVPFRENDLFNGYPEDTNAPYGIAKRALWTMLNAYHKEYGLDYAYLVPSNLYGPGDNFEDTGHVIPALIRKCLEAKASGAPSIEVWGTGSASRDFVYVKDVARALVQTIGRKMPLEPLNLGSGTEVKIWELVHIIKRATGYKGGIAWDHSKPDGQPRRCLDIREASMFLDWRAETELEEGIAETVRWYIDQG